MEWLNLHTSVLDSPAFLGADPVDRATWLCLLRYCIGQENSGIIDNCEDWGDRKWQQLCRVTHKETRQKCELFEWLDGSLIVKQYPIEKQKEVQRLRSQAKAGSDARWHASRHPDGICPADASRQADGMADGTAHGNAEGKGKERKRKEEEDGTATADHFQDGDGKPKGRELLVTALKGLRIDRNPTAVDEWIGFAKNLGLSSFTDAVECIDWCIRKARKSGVEAKYPRHVTDLGTEWLRTFERRPTERIEKTA